MASAFRELIETADVNEIIISYNSEGLLSEEKLESICREHTHNGSFRKIRIPYRRFKSHSGDQKEVYELLFAFKKR